MPDLITLQNVLNIKIFDGIGSNLAVQSISESVVDKWGDSTKTFTSQGTLKAVPYSDIEKRNSYQPFGDLQEGEVDMAFKYDSSIEVGWLVTNVSGIVFQIKIIEEYPFKDGLLVKIARLAKYQA